MLYVMLCYVTLFLGHILCHVSAYNALANHDLLRSEDTSTESEFKMIRREK